MDKMIKVQFRGKDNRTEITYGTSNWTGSVCRISRSFLIEQKTSIEDSSGIFILIGAENTDGKCHLYVGESEQIVRFLKESLDDDPCWEEALTFTRPGNPLSYAEIKSIREKLVEELNRGNTVVTVVGNTTSGPIREEEECDAMEYFRICQMILRSVFPLYLS